MRAGICKGYCKGGVEGTGLAMIISALCARMTFLHGTKPAIFNPRSSDVFLKVS
jgi:hypothetical protein